MAGAGARSRMYRRSRRRASTSSMVDGPAVLTCNRLPPGKAQLVVSRVVDGGAVRVVARVVRPGRSLDAAGDGELLAVRPVRLDRRLAAAERALVARGQDKRDGRRRRPAVDAARILHIRREDTRVAARTLAGLLLVDGVDLVARRPGGGVVEVEHVARRLDTEILVVVAERDVQVRAASQRLPGDRSQSDQVVRRVLG